MIRLVETLAYNLYMVVLGSQAPWAKQLYERMLRPEPGDLVLELSTIHFDDAPHLVAKYGDKRGKRLGVLLRVTREPICAPDAWDEPDAIPEETVTYLRLPDGREFRWVNASFIAVPTEIVDSPFVFTSRPDFNAPT